MLYSNKVLFTNENESEMTDTIIELFDAFIFTTDQFSIFKVLFKAINCKRI